MTLSLPCGRQLGRSVGQGFLLNRSVKGILELTLLYLFRASTTATVLALGRAVSYLDGDEKPSESAVAPMFVF